MPNGDLWQTGSRSRRILVFCKKICWTSCSFFCFLKKPICPNLRIAGNSRSSLELLIDTCEFVHKFPPSPAARPLMGKKKKKKKKNTKHKNQKPAKTTKLKFTYRPKMSLFIKFFRKGFMELFKLSQDERLRKNKVHDRHKKIMSWIIMFWRKSTAMKICATAWPNGYGVWLRIRRLWVRVPSWSTDVFLFVPKPRKQRWCPSFERADPHCVDLIPCVVRVGWPWG